jgi:arylsulfatase A-like enzyme
MNFQAVSVGQKLIRSGVKGGYTDNAATPTAPLLDEIQFVDASIGQMVDELSNQRLLDSTLIVITAKHGQSPIDTHQVNKFKSTSPAHLLTGLLRPSSDPGGKNIGPTEDDVSLLWLADSSNTSAAVAILEANAPADGVGEIFYGPSLTTMFNSPLQDSRTPDIIVQPNVGVIYSTSGKKQAEHGGFAHDDTNVMLLVSKPGLHAKRVTAGVETTQVAPTILQALGLDANSLTAVKTEGTQVLPALFTPGGDGHWNDEK